jgi:hypothetical protein
MEDRESYIDARIVAIYDEEDDDTGEWATLRIVKEDGSQALIQAGIDADTPANLYFLDL